VRQTPHQRHFQDRSRLGGCLGRVRGAIGRVLRIWPTYSWAPGRSRGSSRSSPTAAWAWRAAAGAQGSIRDDARGWSVADGQTIAAVSD
jgi:hypothetical protein